MTAEIKPEMKEMALKQIPSVHLDRPKTLPMQPCFSPPHQVDT
jgi:hypothetical protein